MINRLRHTDVGTADLWDDLAHRGEEGSMHVRVPASAQGFFFAITM